MRMKNHGILPLVSIALVPASILFAFAALLAVERQADASNNHINDFFVAPGPFPSLVLDASGNPVISHRSTSAPVHLRLAHCNDPNCAFGDDSSTEPDGSDAVGAYTSLELDSSGYPVVSYYDGNNNDLKILHCNDVNCTSGDESITAPDATGDVGEYTSLELDSSGYPVVAYRSTTNFDLKLLHCNDPNCAGNDESISIPDAVSNPFAMSLALDSLGYPVVAYRDSISGDLKLLHCNDPNCAGGDDSISTPDTSTVQFVALQLDSLGYPVMSYCRITVSDCGDLAVMHCNDPNCAGSNESITLPDTAGNVGRHTSLALDASGYPVVSYLDTTNGALKILHCNDVNCGGADDASVSTGVALDVDYSTSLVLDSLGYPVVAYYDDFYVELKVLHCITASCGNKPPPTPTPTPPKPDDHFSSLGKFQVLVSPPFRVLFSGYPGFDGVSRLTSPVLHDSDTVVGRSNYHVHGSAADTGGTVVGSVGTVISDGNFSLEPPGFQGPVGTREIHTEIRSLNLTGFGAAVRAGVQAPSVPISPGEVESQSSSGNPADDFPADSFFNVFVEVDLPALGGFPGGTLYNPDPLLVFNDNLESPPGFPPRVVYIHGNTNAVPIFFKTTNSPYWQAGDLFGWLTLAGHGASFDNTAGDMSQFSALYQSEVVASGPLPVADSDSGGAPDDLEIYASGDTLNPSDDSAILAADTDLDGCVSGSELPTSPGSETSGGRRDPTNEHDYFNPSGDGLNRVDDILLVVDAYYADDTDGNPGLPPYAPGYDSGTDRTLFGPLAWNLGPPDGLQRVDDILNQVKQYFHDCV